MAKKKKKQVDFYVVIQTSSHIQSLVGGFNPSEKY